MSNEATKNKTIYASSGQVDQIVMQEIELPEKLRIKAGVMEMGEKIAWGSDTALMREAADRIDTLEKKITAMTEKLQRVSAIEFQIGEEF